MGTVDVWLGQRLPLVPPLGQVLMAWSSLAEVAQWWARDIAQVAAELTAAVRLLTRQLGGCTPKSTDVLEIA